MSTPRKRRRLNSFDDARNTQSFPNREEDMRDEEHVKMSQAGVNQAEVDHEDDVSPNLPSAVAADEDQQQWQGFCEIESDPVSLQNYLNNLLLLLHDVF